MAISITRRNPRTGRIERPWRNRDNLFVLGDPAHGAQKHHDRFAVKVETLEEVARLIERGFSVRMTDGNSPPSLISPDSLAVEDIDTEDVLWAETLPKPPFEKAEMFEELKVALFVQANQIAHAGRHEAAIAFLGFEPVTLVPTYDPHDLQRLDLSRFSATHYVDRAYDYGFQVGRYWDFGADMAQNAIEFLEGATPCDENGQPSPLMNDKSLCRIAIETAFSRWSLENGFSISIRGLALLSGMTEPAVRNSLSKDRIAITDGQIRDEAALAWLKQRRGFIPTRTSEEANREFRNAWARGLLDREGPAKALAEILKDQDVSPQALAERAQVPEGVVTALLDNRPVLDVGALRRIGTALDLDTPHFVGVAIEAGLRAGGAV